MKTLFLAFAFCFLALSQYAQDAKPVSTNFKAIQSPQFYYYTTDSSVWIYKGTPYQWTELSRVSKKYPIWNHTRISNAGWANGKVLKFDVNGNLVPGTATGGSGIALTDLSAVAPINYNNLTGVFGFSGTLFSGAYADLTGKPTIPSAQVNSDWNSISGVSQIFNKPTIPTSQTLNISGTTTPTIGLSGSNTASFIASSGISLSQSFGNIYIENLNPTAYSLPLAASGTRGGIELGYTPQNNTLPVGISLNKAYVGLTSSAIQFALNGQVNTVGGNSIWGSGDIPFVVADGSVSRSKLNIYGGGSDGNVLTYNTTYGLTWSGANSHTHNYAPTFTVTATGTSGAATYSANVLNIPQYSGSDGNNYPTSLSFNYMTGDLSLGISGLATLTTSLNNRYAMATGSSTQSFYVANLYANGAISGVTTLSASGVVTGSNFQLSDRRLKQNIKPITFSNVNQIKFYQFDMIADSSHRPRLGVIAQDVEKIMPELVYTDDKGMKAVNYIDLLIAKIAELESRIQQVEATKSHNSRFENEFKKTDKNFNHEK